MRNSGPALLLRPRVRALLDQSACRRRLPKAAVRRGCPFTLRSVRSGRAESRAESRCRADHPWAAPVADAPAETTSALWAARGAAAASTRGGATARRPAACCPSRLYWGTGTGTTGVPIVITIYNNDCGASPRTRTATRPCSSSRTILTVESRLRSRLYSRRCLRPKTTAGRLAPWERKNKETCAPGRRPSVRCWCWRTRYDAWVAWATRMISLH